MFKIRKGTLKLWLSLITITLIFTSKAYSGNKGSELRVNEKMYVNDYLKSKNGSHRFYVQNDGNLVLYNNNKAVWASSSKVERGDGVKRLTFQGDGNFVLYTHRKGAIWASNTTGSKRGDKLRVRDNGRLTIYRGDREVWSVGSGGEKSSTNTNKNTNNGARGKTRLQVYHNNKWRNVTCNGNSEKIGGDDIWERQGRDLVNITKNTRLYCSERDNAEHHCKCQSAGERFHGPHDGKDYEVSNSVHREDGGPIFPNSGGETCLKVISDSGRMQAKRVDGGRQTSERNWFNGGLNKYGCNFYRLR